MFFAQFELFACVVLIECALILFQGVIDGL
jgi:hypothetical protein